jgi:bile acid-coenzyme A ligase
LPPIPLGRIPTMQAARFGADTWCIRYGDDVLTWGELDERSTRRAWALQDAGVGRGDYVTVGAPNGIDVYEILYAIWKIGATPHVVSSRLPAAELRAIVEVCQPKLVIASDPSVRRILDARPIDFGRHFPRTEVLPEICSNPWKAMSSGGSTGRPKIILTNQPGMFDPDIPSVVQVPRAGVILATGPVYHNMPLTTNLRALGHGAQVVGMERFDPEEALRLIEAFGVVWTSFVPTMMNRISKLPAEVRARYDLSSLKTIWHWAAPMPPALKREWIEWFGPEAIWELYGGTEAIGTTVINGVEWLTHPGSVGKAVSDEIKVLDEQGREVPRAEVGEIYALPKGGQGTTYQYLGAEARSAAGGYETLGDFGWMDEEGYLYIADRRTDMIVSGGANIFPAEVEAVLMEHPGVEGAVVIGLPDADLGAAVHAIVKASHVWRERLDADTLIEFLRERLVRYKFPRSIEFTEGQLRDDAGKVRRQQLREQRLDAGQR